jgi:hypothetical protein
MMQGLQLFGSTAGPIIGGLEQSSALNASAAADRANANRTIYQGELDAYQVDRNARAAVGQGLAQAASDGNAVGTGSIADLVEQSAINREMDIANLRVTAQGHANAYLAAAAAKRTEANGALLKGFLGGALGYASARAEQINSAKVSKVDAANRASKAAGPLARNAPVASATSNAPSWGVVQPRWNSTALPGY